MQRQVVGFASPAQDLISDDFTLDKYLVEHPLNTMFLVMESDAMKGVIQQGDLVIVERTTQAQTGQIVLAQMDGTYFIRYLGMDRKGMFLYGTARNLTPLRPTNEIVIVGVVTGLARKFRYAHLSKKR
ncbi:MAG: S24 family peptidase [bacterium]|nr:S24 family peptidase [bacterium]